MGIEKSKMLRRVTQLSLSRGLAVSQTRLQERELIVEKLTGEDEGIYVWGLNRPKSKNALGKNVFKEIRYDPNARALIVRSTTPGIFSAGADLKERRTIAPEDVGPMVARGRRFFREFQEMPVPTIAALDGFALGGGLEWAISHDLRVASDTAKMGVTETKLAIIPGGGGTQNLARLVGVSKAKELVFTARMINGIEAERL